MSDPRHVNSARMMLDQMMADPDGPETLRLAHEGVREGRWGEHYIDSIGQGPYSTWPMEQLAVFARLHAMVYSGDIARALIATPAPPEADSMREENAAALSRLPRPFAADVDMKQRNSGGDGVLSWDEPIRVSLCTGLIDRAPDGSTYPLTVSYEMPPGSAVLEIGQSLASRSWQHLVLDGGRLARWPYGHSRIMLFLNLDYGSWMTFAAEMINAHRRKSREPAA